jgi:hypothetical protein
MVYIGWLLLIMVTDSFVWAMDFAYSNDDPIIFIRYFYIHIKYQFYNICNFYIDKNK